MTDLTDDELAERLDAILAEQERRQRLATIPATITALAAQYVAGGGDKGDLEAALGDARADVTEPTNDQVVGAAAIASRPVE